MFKKFLKILWRSFLVLLGLLLLVWLLLQTSPVQNFLVGKVTTRLSADLHTEVRVKNVSFSFFDKMDLNGVLLRDLSKDTLLYAGTMKVRITDWFFMRDSADLTYIGLEDAVIKLARKDSVWNYQFIADYFSPKEKTADTSSKKGISLNIQKLDLKKVRFTQNDEWIGQLLTIKAGSLLLDADKMDLNNSEFLINSIDLDRPYFSIENFDGQAPENNNSVADTAVHFNAGGMLVKAKTIKITNGYFGNLKRGEVPEKGLFDGANIQVNKLNADIKNFSFDADTIKAKVNISAVERSGFELKKLSADYKLTPQVMEFRSLNIQTPKSSIGDYYAMRYKNFNDDMSEFVDKVIIDARLKNSLVSSDDIAYFAPELADWNKKATVNGRFYGPIRNFSVSDLFLRTDANTYAAGTLTMKGLPDIDKTQIFFTGIVQTNNKEIAFLYPDLLKITSPDLASLGNIQFKGDYKGTIRNINLKGNLSSSIGGMNTDISLNIPAKGEPTYTGIVQTQQFDLGKFLGVSSLGAATFKGKIEGKSFAIEKAKTALNGTFSNLEFNGYNYNNLEFNGNIEKQKFTGDFKANDPNFDFTSAIEIDLTGTQPRFNILGDLQNADFKALNFTTDKLQLTGLFDLNFTGRNIDEFLGDAKILNATLIHDTTQLDFDSLTISASYNDTLKKILTAKSNQFTATVSGEYNILDLPNSFQAYLSNYFPSYINAPKTTPKNQRFAVSVHTYDFDSYAKSINSKLSGFSNMNINGAVNTEQRDSGFFIHAIVPDAGFQQYKLSDAEFIGLGSFDSLRLNGSIGRLYISDSMFFHSSNLSIVSSNDESEVHISSGANQTLNDADLNAHVTTLPEGVSIIFQPSSFILNGKKWELEKQGEITIRKNFATASNVKFKQGFQEIVVESVDEEAGNTSNLLVKVINLNLGDIVPLFASEPRMEGLANGSIYLRDFYNKFKADGSLKVNEFRLDDDSIGIVNLTSAYNSENGKISFGIQSENERYNFSGDGYYNLRDSTNVPLNASMHLDHTRIRLLNRFLGDLFKNIDGNATGNIRITGKANAPQLLGEAMLRDAALTVDYTKVRYNIDSAYFVFKDDRIDFGKFTLKDKYGNTGSARGILYQKGFKNMSFDFDVATSQLLLLDTKATDNQQFFGKAIGKATLSLKGPLENMRMSIAGQVTDTSQISIQTTDSKEVGAADFIRFKTYGTEAEKPKKSDTKLSIDLDLTANNKAEISLILDALTGDVIKATGNGRLNINVPATGDMTMKGRYNIERGSYNFNFQNFLRKPFILKEDAGSFVEWTGDPYNANMRIDAQYTAKNVSFSDLLSNANYRTFQTSTLAYRDEVYVVATLSGKLTSPDIKFRFELPSTSPVKSDRFLEAFLQKIESDDNEMLKQVTWLIVFDGFAPYGEIGSGGSTVRSAGINTLSSKITGELNKVVSNLLFKLTGDKSLQFDVNTSTYSSSELYGTTSSGNNLDRQTINLKVNQSLLNNRVIVTFGTGLDFNLSSSAAVQGGNFQWLPDISVKILLSKTGKISAIIFNKSSLDVSGVNIGRRTRQGVSLSYSIDFPKEELQTIPPANPQPDSTSGSR